MWDVRHLGGEGFMGSRVMICLMVPDMVVARILGLRILKQEFTSVDVPKDMVNQIYQRSSSKASSFGPFIMILLYWLFKTLKVSSLMSVISN